jgi:hypothetical protein
MSEQGVANNFGSAEFGDDLEDVRPLLQSLDQIPRKGVNLARSRGRPCKHVSIGASLADYSVQLLFDVSMSDALQLTVMVEIAHLELRRVWAVDNPVHLRHQ